MGAERLSAIIGHEFDSRRGIKEKWTAVDAVVHGKCVTGSVVWTTTILVGLRNGMSAFTIQHEIWRDN